MKDRSPNGDKFESSYMLLKSALADATEYTLPMLGSMSQAARQSRVAQLRELTLENPSYDSHLGATLLHEITQILLSTHPKDIAQTLLQLKTVLSNHIRYYYAALAEAGVAHVALQQDYLASNAPLRVFRPSIEDDMELGLDWIIGHQSTYFGVNVKTHSRRGGLQFSISRGSSITMPEIHIPYHNRSTYIFTPSMAQDLRYGLYECLNDANFIRIKN